MEGWATVRVRLEDLITLVICVAIVSFAAGYVFCLAVRVP